MMGEELNAAEVTDRGLVGDRQFADFAELVARVRALARRSTPALPPTLEAGDLTLDPSRRVAFRGDSPQEVVKAAVSITADPETAERWRAELAAGRLPHDSEDEP